MVRLAILFVAYLFLIGYCMAEGTKELRPAESDKGNLLLWGDYTMFGQYDAPPESRIKIRVASVDETIYIGLNNKNGIPQDDGPFVPEVPFRIVSPSGVTVYSSEIPGVGEEGHINTWEEAVAGPAELGNANGYDGIEIDPDETGDYIIEFDPLALTASELNPYHRLNIHLFDVTVADDNGQAVTGRLHSQGWQISGERFEYPFNGKVYPYDSENAVYEVDFNGMQPLVFVINFNSTGTGNSKENFLESRKSKIGNHTLAEFDVFLNPPDPGLFPVDDQEVNFTTSVERTGCISSEFCLDFDTDSEGFLEGFLDFNNNNLYDEHLGEIYFNEYINDSDSRCIEWDGRDAFGNVVEEGNFQILSVFGVGPTHLPLYDVEHNRNGYKVSIARPADATDPVLFWDDSYITEGSTMGDPLVNLSGCTGASGCHRWENRGSIKDSDALEDQETINTWWYSQIIYDTILYSMPAYHEVKLSYDPVSLVQGDTTVCSGDSLDFYVYNDGKNHFDVAKYEYEWQFNSMSAQNDVRELAEQISGPSEVILKAIDRTADECVSQDTLRIFTVDPVQINAELNDDTCGSGYGFIDIEIIDGPPDPQISWKEFPDNTTGYLDSLAAGTYNLSVMDPDFSLSCALDTFFTITELRQVLIDTLINSGTLCYKKEGEAEVVMYDQSRSYQYSWNAGPFSSVSSVNSLSAGSHTVSVKDLQSGCMVHETFQIPSAPLSYNINSENELCNNSTGRIELEFAEDDLDIYWNGVPGTKVEDNLSSGSYQVEIRSSASPSCHYDTVIHIRNVNYKVEADFSYKTAGGTEALSTISFLNLSEATDSVWWNFGDGAGSAEVNPVHEYEEPGDYTINLTVADSNGCTGSASKRLTVNDTGPCGIALPNAFTPNEDHINNTIGILGYAPEVELKIFNRWGEVIFRTFELEKRWDGTYREDPVGVGVYPYILDWKCPDENGNLVHYQEVGDISLIR